MRSLIQKFVALFRKPPSLWTISTDSADSDSTLRFDTTPFKPSPGPHRWLNLNTGEWTDA